MREGMQSFPIGWTDVGICDDARCHATGNSYQVKIYAKVVENLDKAPIASAYVLGKHQSHIGSLHSPQAWRKWMQPILFAAGLKQGSAAFCRAHEDEVGHRTSPQLCHRPLPSGRGYGCHV